MIYPRECYPECRLLFSCARSSFHWFPFLRGFLCPSFSVTFSLRNSLSVLLSFYAHKPTTPGIVLFPARPLRRQLSLRNPPPKPGSPGCGSAKARPPRVGRHIPSPHCALLRLLGRAVFRIQTLTLTVSFIPPLPKQPPDTGGVWISGSRHPRPPNAGINPIPQRSSPWPVGKSVAAMDTIRGTTPPNLLVSGSLF